MTILLCLLHLPRSHNQIIKFPWAVVYIFLLSLNTGSTALVIEHTLNKAPFKECHFYAIQVFLESHLFCGSFMQLVL